MKEVHSAELKKVSDDYYVIEWSGDDGFGVLTAKYTDDGKYTLDTEFLNFESVIKIIQKLNI
jgi:hypothetical protein